MTTKMGVVLGGVLVCGVVLVLFNKALFELMWDVSIGKPQSSEMMVYNRAQFETFQAQNRKIVLVVHAGWCPQCRLTLIETQRLLRQPQYHEIVQIKVDYDQDKSELRRLRIPDRSTVVAYQGRQEVGRVVGLELLRQENKLEPIQQLLEQLLRVPVAR